LLSQDGRIEGIDISQFQDDYATVKKPDLRLAAANGARFYYMRTSYGRVEDRMFRYFLEQGRGLMDQAAYHYMDYYSHPSLGYNSTKWGVIQGEKIISLLKNDHMPIFIDVESASPAYAPNISTVWGTAMTILDNILKVVDDHFGTATGIYASTGWLGKFYPYHRWRPLAAANYNPTTPESIRRIVKNAGWTDLVIWQYASHGDINGDGIPDGKLMGMETAALDLDLWMQDQARYDEFFRKDSPVVTDPADGEEAPIDKPDDEVLEQKPNMKSVEIKKVKQGRGGLRVRTSVKAPTLFSLVQDKLVEGTEVEILERVVSGNYTWVRIGYRQWVCEREGVTVYLE
jgi:hypothetical protein